MKARKAHLKLQVRLNFFQDEDLHTRSVQTFLRKLDFQINTYYFFFIQESDKSGKKILAGAISVFPGRSINLYDSKYQILVCFIVLNQRNLFPQITACSVQGLNRIQSRARRMGLQLLRPALPPNRLLRELLLVKEAVGCLMRMRMMTSSVVQA